MSPFSTTVWVGTVFCVPEYIFRKSCYSVSLKRCEKAAFVLTQFSFGALKVHKCLSAGLPNLMLSPDTRAELGHSNAWP